MCVAGCFYFQFLCADAAAACSCWLLLPSLSAVGLHAYVRLLPAAAVVVFFWKTRVPIIPVLSFLQQAVVFGIVRCVVIGSSSAAAAAAHANGHFPPKKCVNFASASLARAHHRTSYDCLLSNNIECFLRSYGPSRYYGRRIVPLPGCSFTETSTQAVERALENVKYSSSSSQRCTTVGTRSHSCQPSMGHIRHYLLNMCIYWCVFSHQLRACE